MILTAKIVMEVSSADNSEDAQWGTIRKPPEIENMREIEG
jgi:hypothetical protein